MPTQQTGPTSATALGNRLRATTPMRVDVARGARSRACWEGRGLHVPFPCPQQEGAHLGWVFAGPENAGRHPSPIPVCLPAWKIPRAACQEQERHLRGGNKKPTQVKACLLQKEFTKAASALKLQQLPTSISPGQQVAFEHYGFWPVHLQLIPSSGALQNRGPRGPFCLSPSCAG